MCVLFAFVSVLEGVGVSEVLMQLERRAQMLRTANDILRSLDLLPKAMSQTLGRFLQGVIIFMLQKDHPHCCGEMESREIRVR